MAIAHSASSNSGAKLSVSSITYSHTVSAGDNRLLVVQAGFSSSSASVTGITYDGDALTKAIRGTDSSEGGISSELWYLVQPNEGTANVVVTISGTVGRAASGASSYTGVDNNPLNVTGYDTGSDDPSVTLTTTVDGCMVVDGIYHTQEISDPDGGNTAVYSEHSLGGGDCCGSSYELAGAKGNVTTSWSNNRDHILVSAAFKPVMGGGSFIFNLI